METDTKTGLPITYKQAPGGAPYPSPSGQIGVTAHPPSNEANTQYGAPPGAYGPSVPSYPAHSSAAAQPLQPPPNQTYFITNVPAGFGNLEGLIPIMPLWAAITLCVVNCIMPGFGTMVAAMAVCCCADTRHQQNSTAVGLFCINFVIGWAQFFSVCIFLVGWAWSIMWGILFVRMSSQLYGKPPGTTTTTIIQQTIVPT